MDGAARPALLLSLGFRPSWLEPSRVWQLAASVSLAMADAAEPTVGLAPGSVRLKWPNDLVVGDRRRRASGSLAASSARPRAWECRGRPRSWGSA